MLGLLPCTLILVYYVVVHLHLFMPVVNIYEVPLLGYSILFLALSMSIYLARDFAVKETAWPKRRRQPR